MIDPQIVTAPPAQPAPMAVGGDFAINPADPQAGVLMLQAGPAGFQLMMPTASVVGFLRSLADNIEKKIQATPTLVRPTSGLFLPG